MYYTIVAVAAALIVGCGFAARLLKSAQQGDLQFNPDYGAADPRMVAVLGGDAKYPEDETA